MVHALQEIWRVLAPGGRLVDLRPIAAAYPLDVLRKGRSIEAGKLSARPKAPVHTAANEAIAEVLARDLFAQQEQISFEYAYYWDTVEAMKAYVTDRWQESAILPAPVEEAARRMVSVDPAGSVLRIRRTVCLATYGKRG